MAPNKRGSTTAFPTVTTRIYFKNKENGKASDQTLPCQHHVSHDRGVCEQ